MKAKKTKTPRKENRLCKVGMEVQTVIFDTVIWNKKDAKKWLIDHGFKKTRGILEGPIAQYGGELAKIKLVETENNFVEYYGGKELF